MKSGTLQRTVLAVHYQVKHHMTHYMDTAHFLIHSSISWTFSLFSYYNAAMKSVYKFLHVLSFLLGTCLSEWLGHMVTLSLTFWRTEGCFPKWRHSQWVYQGSNFSTFLPMLVRSFFIIATLVGVKCHLTVVVICISQITNDVEHIFMFIGPCVSPLSIYSVFTNF